MLKLLKCRSWEGAHVEVQFRRLEGDVGVAGSGVPEEVQ